MKTNILKGVLVTPITGLILFTFLFTFLEQTNKVEAAPLEFMPPMVTTQADPGETITFTHTLTNTGVTTDSFSVIYTETFPWVTGSRFQIVGSDAQDLVTPPGATEIELGADTYALITVSVSVPAGSTAGIVHTATITATSQADSNHQLSVEDTTTVAAAPKVEITPANNKDEAYPGETVVYNHTVTNLSNRAETVALSVNQIPGWTVNIQPSELALERDASGTVTVYVMPPPDAVEGMESVTVTASIGDVQDTATNETTVRHRKVYLPMLVKPARWESVGSGWPEGVTARSLALCKNNPTVMLAGTIDHGVQKLSGESWVSAGNVPVGHDITGLVMNGDCDEAFAGAYGAGVWKAVKIGDSWTWSQLGNNEVSNVRTLAMSGNTLVAGGDFGIRFWNGSSWQAVNGLPKNPIIMYISAADPADADGKFYAVQWQNGQIYQSSGSNPQIWSVMSYGLLPKTDMRTVFGTPEGVSLVGTQSSAYQRSGNDWQQLPVAAGLRSAAIGGNVAYLGFTNNQGVYKLQDSTLLPINAGWTNPEYVYGLALANGQLYAATSDGVFSFSLP